MGLLRNRLPEQIVGIDVKACIETVLLAGPPEAILRFEIAAVSALQSRTSNERVHANASSPNLPFHSYLTMHASFIVAGQSADKFEFTGDIRNETQYG